MPAWFLPLMSLLAMILVALVVNIAAACYWGGRMAGKVEALDKNAAKVLQDLKDETVKREQEIKAERTEREREIRSVWKRIDELRDTVAQIATTLAKH